MELNLKCWFILVVIHMYNTYIYMYNMHIFYAQYTLPTEVMVLYYIESIHFDKLN